MNLPYEILELVQHAANQQVAVGELLCEYGLAYEDCEGRVCIQPMYLGMGLSGITGLLKQRIKQASMTVSGDLIVNGDYVESGGTKTVSQTFEHVEHFHQNDKLRMKNDELQAEESHQNDELRMKNDELQAEFRYISPFVTDESERRHIHKVVVNLVTGAFGFEYICKQLDMLHKEKKIALNTTIENQYKELVRLGLPSGEKGFSLKNYQNYMGSRG